MSEYRNCITGELCADLEFRKKIPNESFPLTIADEDLLKYGYERVYNSAKPVPGKNQLVVLDGTQKDTNNHWVYKYKLVDIPKEIVLAKLVAKQNQAWARIEQERTRIGLGGILVNGKWFHTDNESLTKYLSMVVAGENILPNIMWKTMDGSKILMTAQLVKDIYNTAMTFSNTVFNHGEVLKELMLASEDPDKFDASLGWPTVFSK